MKKMKKILSVVLVVAMLLSNIYVVALAADDVSFGVSLETNTFTIGTDKWIKIDIKNTNQTPIGAAQFYLYCDTSVFSIAEKETTTTTIPGYGDITVHTGGDVLFKGDYNTGAVVQHNTIAAADKAGTYDGIKGADGYVIVWGGKTTNVNDEDMCSIYLVANEGSVNGDYAISFGLSVVSDVSENVLVGGFANDGTGTITVTGGIPREDLVPQFNAALTDKSFTYGGAAPTLDATATVVKTDDAEAYPAYQWYKTDSKDADGTAIEDATSATFTHGLSDPSAFYYCVVTNVFGGVTYTARTATVQVTANKRNMNSNSLNVDRDCGVYPCWLHTYNGNSHGLKVERTWSGDYGFLSVYSNKFTYTYVPVADGVEGDALSGKPVDAGKYNVYVSFAGNDYWNAMEKTYVSQLTITPAEITVTGDKALTVYNNGISVAITEDDIKGAPVDNSTLKVTYSENSNLINVDANGNVTATGTGTGPAEVTVTFTDEAGNHTTKSETVTVTVEAKKEATVTATAKVETTVNYDPNTTYAAADILDVSAVAKDTSDALTDGTYTYTITKDGVAVDEIKNTGTYTITATYTDDYYSGTSEAVTFTIRKALVPTEQLPTVVTGLVYNNQTQNGVTAPGLGTYYTLTGGATKATEANGYTATFTLSDPTNYKWEAAYNEAVREYSWSIAKATIAAADEPAKATVVPYTGSEQQGVTFKVGVGYGIVGGMEATHGTAAGTYTAAFTLDANHTWSDGTTTNKVITWTIEQATITIGSDVKWNYTNAYTYDGNAKTVELTGLDTTKVKADYTDNAKTDAGQYTAKVALSAVDSKNYTVSGTVADLDWEIKAKNINVSTVAWNYTNAFDYNGEAKTVALVNVPAADIVTVTYSGDALTQTNAKTYNTTAALTAASTNYNLVGRDSYELPLTWSINKATVTVPTAKTDLKYNGSEQTGVVDGENYSVTGNTGIDAKTDYEATATLDDSNNYKWSDESFGGKITWGIAKADKQDKTAAASLRYSNTDEQTFTAVDIKTLLGDTNENTTITITSVSTGTNAVLAADASVKEGAVAYQLKSGLTDAATNLTAVITINYSSNNYENGTVALTVTVMDKNDVSGEIAFDLSDVDLTYTGQNQIDAVKIAKRNGSDANITYDITEAVNADSYTIVATYEDADNYGTKTQTFTIKPAPITVKDDATVAEKTYDGTKTASVSGVDFNGLFGQDTVAFNTTAAEFNSADVKDANKVTYTVALESSVKNYTLTDASGETDATIKPLSVTVTLGTIDEQTYTNSTLTPAVTVTAEDTVGGYSLTEGTDYTVSYTDNKNAGEATVTVTAKSGSNYTFTVDPVKFTIKAADLTSVEANDVTVDYTGEALTGAIITGTAKFNGTNVTGTWDFVEDTTEIKNAGNYIVTAKFTPASDNFNEATASFTVTVNKVKLAVPTARTGLVYTGSAQKGVVTADDLLDYVDAVGVFQTNAGNFAATFTIKDTTNYEWTDGTTEVKKIVWSIAKANPTGEPTYTKITTEGKTLADVELALGTLPEDGTIIWIDENGAQLSSDTKVEANKKYTWKYIPSTANAGNYNEITGEITPYAYIPYVPTIGNQVTTPVTQNGKVTTSASGAAVGSTVYVTVTPESGYKLGTLVVTDARGNVIPVTDLGNGRYSFTMPQTAVSVNAKFASIERVTFIDVPAYEWYHDAVYYAYDNGLMNGIGDGSSFGPTAKLTRAMLMTILARLDGVDTNGGATWYTKGMEWAKANGISDGTNPEGNIDRQQTVTMLWRYVGSPVVSGNYMAGYTDESSVSSWAKDAMNWAVSVGLIQGNDGKLNPTGTASRAEIATMLMRFIENVIK